MAQVKVNALSFAHLIKYLQAGPRTKPELAELTGLHVWTVRSYVDAMHREGVLHIAAWRKDGRGRDVTAVYRMGLGADVPRNAKPAAQKARERRQRARQERTPGGALGNPFAALVPASNPAE